MTALFFGPELFIMIIVLIVQYWPWIVGAVVVALAYYLGRNKITIKVEKRD